MKYLKSIFSQLVAAFSLALIIFLSSPFIPSLTLVAEANQVKLKTVEQIDQFYDATHNLQPSDPNAVEKGLNIAEDRGNAERPIGETGLKNIKQLGKNIPETAKEVRENFGLNR